MTEKDEEWGPWIKHDGSGCPCIGYFVHVKFKNAEVAELMAVAKGSKCWDWMNFETHGLIMEYRIRKPRALTELRDMVKNMDQDAWVSA